MLETQGSDRSGRSASLAWLLIALVSVVSLHSQTPDRAQDVFRSRTDMVTLDVTVLDRNRRPVRDLTAADFVIVDGGETRAVSAFTAVALPSGRGRSADGIDRVVADVAINDVVSTNDDTDGRLVAILLDHSIPPGWGAQAARRVAHAVVDELGEADRAAVVFTDRALSQSFTADRTKLRAAIDSPVVGTSVSQAGAKPRKVETWEVGLGWTMLSQRQEMSPPPPSETGNCFCGLCSLDAITTVAESVAGVSNRRKFVVFIGGYLPLASEAYDKDTPCSAYVPPAFRRMFAAAQRANLAIYAFDPNGLITPAQHGGRARIDRYGLVAPDSQSTLRAPAALLTAADHTGGRAILNTNAPQERVVDVFEETSSYYLIGFEPAPTTAAPGTFRPVTVRVNRPGVEVRARSGYYVTDDAARDARDPLAAAVSDLLPRGTQPTQMALAAFPGQDTMSSLAIVTAIERDTTAPVELLATIFDRAGRPVASVRDTVALPDTPAQPGTDEFFIGLEIPEPGGYHVRVALRDTGTGEISSVHDTIDVPAFARMPVSLSGLAVHTARLSQRSVTALSDFLPIVPTTRRTFVRDEAVTVFAEVGQAGSAQTAVRMTARVVDAAGALLLEHGDEIPAASFAREGRPFYRLDLPLARLVSGEYLLTVQATRGSDNTSRSLRFRVN